MELNEEELWLCVDPGESTGWSLWRGPNLIDAGTTELWAMGQSVFVAMFRPEEADLIGDELAIKFQGITKIVCEDWRLYPWEVEAGNLDWDQCRTARLIGALTLIAQQANLQWFLQPAKIKEHAMAAGAKHLFLKPLHENRHANDSIMHGVYHLAVEAGAQGVMQMREPPSHYKHIKE